MTTRAMPAHKQPSRLLTIADVMAHDDIRARQAAIYFEWLEAKKVFQANELAAR